MATLEAQAGTAYNDLLRYFILEELDRCWKDHLVDMDHLRDGIGLRGYGQRDPKQEYKREGFEMFRAMLDRIKTNTARVLCRLKLRRMNENNEEVDAQGNVIAQAPNSDPTSSPTTAAQQDEVGDNAAKLGLKHKSQPSALSYSGPDEDGAAKKQTLRRAEPRVGRNDPCPCGSGKKHKKCCGA